MAYEKEFPLPMFKDKHRPITAHSQKEYKELTAIGFQDDQRNIAPQEYPKWKYHADGRAEQVGHYDPVEVLTETFRFKCGVIDIESAKAHEALLEAEGYTRKTPATIAPAQPEVQHANSTVRLEKLEAEVRDIKNSLDRILDAIQQPAAAQSGGRRGRQGRSSTVAED